MRAAGTTKPAGLWKETPKTTPQTPLKIKPLSPGAENTECFSPSPATWALLFPICYSIIAPEPRTGHQGVPEEPGWGWKQLPDQFLWKEKPFGVYQQWRSFSPPGAPVHHPREPDPKKSGLTSPPSRPWACFCSSWRGWWGFFGFFSLFPKGFRGTAGAESSPGGYFPQKKVLLCGQVNQELPGDGGCAHPPKSLCPGTTWLILPLKRGFSLGGKGQKSVYFFPYKPERMIENPQKIVRGVPNRGNVNWAGRVNSLPSASQHSSKSFWFAKSNTSKPHFPALPGRFQVGVVL